MPFWITHINCFKHHFDLVFMTADWPVTLSSSCWYQCSDRLTESLSFFILLKNQTKSNQTKPNQNKTKQNKTKQNKTKQRQEATSSTACLQTEVRLQWDASRRQNVMVEQPWKIISKTYYHLASLENTYPLGERQLPRKVPAAFCTLRNCYVRHYISKTWV